MLMIRYWAKGDDPYAHNYVEWHLGEELPADMGRVVEFQADGDELYLFLQAMRTSRDPVDGIYYSKVGGFQILEGYSE